MAFSATRLEKRSEWPYATQSISPAIMESIDSSSLLSGNKTYNGLPQDGHSLNKTLLNMPDVTLTSEFTTLKLGSADNNDNINKSVLLLDGAEHLKVSSAEEFLAKLGCHEKNLRVKVVSIFGNTGDGKSHTLNHVFFNGDEVFQTSREQDSCTLGVWIAYDPVTKVLCLDTEGLLGATNKENQRTRLLLKVLAVSDVVIYRTRSERLHRDMFTFLGWSSRAYSQHFQSALQSVCDRADSGLGSISSMGPAIVIFHETQHTTPLLSCGVDMPEDLLKHKFKQLGLETDAFCSLSYIGVQTIEPPTSYAELSKWITSELKNTNVRSPRSPLLVYSALKAINDKFSGEIIQNNLLFPDEYFTCPSVCLSCSSRCQLTMGHSASGSQHTNIGKCRYQHQYENIIYVCKACHTNGREVIVVPKYGGSSESSWFGLANYIIECPHCGEIYRSRQFWYGNNPPEFSAVRTEIHHVWPGNAAKGQSAQNSAQRVLDGVSYLTEAVASVSAQPTKLLGSWMADQIAPKYWRPNHEIKKCCVCQETFTPSKSIHHCRSCGEGVCQDCSTHKKPVPDRGWEYPVRVCDTCYNPPVTQDDYPGNGNPEETEVIVRKVGEAVVTTFSSVASILEYPKSVIKDTARPTYWVPDSEARECCVCSDMFTGAGGKAELHHCRGCGGPVCSTCSTSRLPVPHRGWPNPVRVCDACASKSD